MYARLTPYWDVMGLPKTCIPFDFNLESSLELLLKGSESLVLIMAISIDADFSNRQELDSLWSYLAAYQEVKKELE